MSSNRLKPQTLPRSQTAMMAFCFDSPVFGIDLPIGFAVGGGITGTNGRPAEEAPGLFQREQGAPTGPSAKGETPSGDAAFPRERGTAAWRALFIHIDLPVAAECRPVTESHRKSTSRPVTAEWEETGISAVCFKPMRLRHEAAQRPQGSDHDWLGKNHSAMHARCLRYCLNRLAEDALSRGWTRRAARRAFPGKCRDETPLWGFMQLNWLGVSGERPGRSNSRGWMHN